MTTTKAQIEEIAHQLKAIDSATSFFSNLMTARMLAKHEQGCRGWNDPVFLPIWRRKLIECAARVYAGDSNQCVDLANWAMIVDACERRKQMF